MNLVAMIYWLALSPAADSQIPRITNANPKEIQIQMQFDKDFGPIVNFLHEFVPKLNIEEGNKKYQTSILLHGP